MPIGKGGKMNKKNKKVETFDLYDGKHISCWAETDGWTYLSFRDSGATLSFPPNDQKKIFGELLEVSSILVEAMVETKKKK